MTKKIVYPLLENFIHDFNNSLTVLNLALDDKDYEFVEKESDSMGRALGHLSTLLFLEKEAFPRRNIAISQEIKKICEMHPCASISFQVEPELYCLQGNLSLLKYVLEELLDNAFRNQANMVHIRAFRENDISMIVVEDDGIGIEISPQLFSPFHKTSFSKEKLRGLALGLFTVRQIVSYMEGDIEVEKSQEKTIFTLRLP